VVNLNAQGARSSMNIEEYIDTHCLVGNEKVRSQLPIQAINNLSLNIVILILTRITGSNSLQQASRPLMFYSVECLRPMVYDWCTLILDNMKIQLT
jgi:hypothetical protein